LYVYATLFRRLLSQVPTVRAMLLPVSSLSETQVASLALS
jgi:hypothetical protein